LVFFCTRLLASTHTTRLRDEVLGQAAPRFVAWNGVHLRAVPRSMVEAIFWRWRDYALAKT
jgi:hypothetical protein